MFAELGVGVAVVAPVGTKVDQACVVDRDAGRKGGDPACAEAAVIQGVET